MKNLFPAVLLFLVSCSPDPVIPLVQQKKVAILIANNGFFYQEYADPRSALEASGITVMVLAGEISPAIPHPDTGQGAGVIGAVSPDLTVAQARAEDFDALVISGGWGATKYYYGYAGNLDDSQWAPDSTLSGVVNNLIGDFLTQGKTVTGVCNGVNVLSWARVGGVSPLKGKTVSAPYLDVPPQTYKNIHYGSAPGNTLPMYTFAVDNGATVRPFNSLGIPGTGTDDVSVDGQIITAQDNFSALRAGEILAKQLKP